MCVFVCCILSCVVSCICAVCDLMVVSCALLFFFSSRRRHTRCALVTGVQTCALPICKRLWSAISMEVPLLAARRKAEARFSDYILILESDRGYEPYHQPASYHHLHRHSPGRHRLFREGLGPALREADPVL